MLTDSEKDQIIKSYKNGKVPDDLKEKLLEEIKSGNRNIFAPDQICCQYFNMGSNHYECCDSTSCDYVGGTVVDNSNCGGC